MSKISISVSLHIVDLVLCGKQLGAGGCAEMRLVGWLGLVVVSSIPHGTVLSQVLALLMVCPSCVLDFTAWGLV